MEIECEKIYKKLINQAGGFNIVRPGMKGRAKQMAMNCYSKRIEPNYEKFKNDVKKANSINNYRKNKSKATKTNMKNHDIFADEEKEIEAIMFKILDEFQVKIPLICRPWNVKEAWDLYCEIKNTQENTKEVK